MGSDTEVGTPKHPTFAYHNLQQDLCIRVVWPARAARRFGHNHCRGRWLRRTAWQDLKMSLQR